MKTPLENASGASTALAEAARSLTEAPDSQPVRDALAALETASTLIGETCDQLSQ